MASSVEALPAELMRPERKLAVIEWIRATALPSRFKRKLLQDWGATVGVELAGTDYEAVTGGGGR